MGSEAWTKKKADDGDVQRLAASLADTILLGNRPLADKILAACDFYEAPAGALLVNEGETSSDFFFLSAGTVSVLRAGAPVAQLGAGAFFGEMALLVNEKKRYATIKADEPCRFFVLSAPRFQSLVTQIPRLGQLLKSAAEARRQGL